MTRPTSTFRLLAIACLWAFGTDRALEADTVYLKNGSFINGVVIAREDSVILRIGNLGQVEIPKDEVHEIEKNGLTGAEGGVPVEDREAGAQKPPFDSDDPGEGGDAEEGQKGESGADAPAESDKSSETEKGDANDGQPDSSTDTHGPSQDEEEPLDPKLEKEIRESISKLKSTNPKHRIRAETRLRSIGAPAVPMLLPLLQHEFELVRIAGARLLNEIGDDRANDALIAALLDSNEYVRDYANKALERINREDFGYRPSASPRRREASRMKWLKWWERQKEEREKERAEEIEKSSSAGSNAGSEAKTASSKGEASTE